MNKQVINRELPRIDYRVILAITKNCFKSEDTPLEAIEGIAFNTRDLVLYKDRVMPFKEMCYLIESASEVYEYRKPLDYYEKYFNISFTDTEPESIEEYKAFRKCESMYLMWTTGEL